MPRRHDGTTEISVVNNPPDRGAMSWSRIAGSRRQTSMSVIWSNVSNDDRFSRFHDQERVPSWLDLARRRCCSASPSAESRVKTSADSNRPSRRRGGLRPGARTFQRVCCGRMSASVAVACPLVSLPLAPRQRSCGSDSERDADALPRFFVDEYPAPHLDRDELVQRARVMLAPRDEVLVRESRPL